MIIVKFSLGSWGFVWTGGLGLLKLVLLTQHLRTSPLFVCNPSLQQYAASGVISICFFQPWKVVTQVRIENDSGSEWRPETESQVCKTPSLVSISQKETETCIALSPGLSLISSGPRLDHVILFQILAASALYNAVCTPCNVLWLLVSISGGIRRRRNESRNNQYFTIFTHPGCYLPLSPLSSQNTLA